MEIFLGVVVSLVVQTIKKVAGTSEYATLGITALVAFVGAAGYYFLAQTDFWPSLLQIGAYAGAFYTFILARFPNAQGSGTEE